jgi:hypothetical protein
MELRGIGGRRDVRGGGGGGGGGGRGSVTRRAMAEDTTCDGGWNVMGKSRMFRIISRIFWCIFVRRPGTPRAGGVVVLMGFDERGGAIA